MVPSSGLLYPRRRFKHTLQRGLAYVSYVSSSLILGAQPWVVRAMAACRSPVAQKRMPQWFPMVSMASSGFLQPFHCEIILVQEILKR